jgi:aspartyl/asparaginyl beta-hydroxylase (cupin superfamily)
MMKINHWFQLGDGGDQRLRFHDVDRVCPQLRQFETHVNDIRQEFQAVDAELLPRLHETEPMHECISNRTPEDWRVGILCLCGRWSGDGQDRFPVTTELLAETPGLVDAFFSVLDPGKTIPPHQGFYAGLLRYQIGVEIPDIDPPTLWLDGESHTWEQGQGVMWDDTFTHSVTNTSPSRRVILIVDVKRPMLGARRVVNWLLVSVVGRVYAELVYRRSFTKDFQGLALPT